MNQKRAGLILLIGTLLYAVTLAGCGPAGNPPASTSPSWPRWRGARGDGLSTETAWNPMAVNETAKVLWNQKVGVGYSDVVIQDGRLYTMGLLNRELRIVCLDAGSGKLIWRNATESFWWPQSTPAIYGGRLYCLNQDGILLCLKASNGRLIWKRDLAREIDAQRPMYGWAGSPVVDGNVLLVNGDTKELGFEPTTGKLLWSIDDTVPVGSWGSYATPVVSDIGGVRGALFLGPNRLIAADLMTGREIWSYAHGDVAHVADPIVSGDEVFVALGATCTMLTSSKAGTEVVWSNTEFTTWLAPPVLVNGYLYGSYVPPEYSASTWDSILETGLPFGCLDWKSGRKMWKQDMKYVAVTAAGDKLIMLELDGTLHVAEATPASYKELTSSKVLADSKRPRVYATPPVLCGGRIYCRSFAGDLVCIDVSK